MKHRFTPVLLAALCGGYAGCEMTRTASNPLPRSSTVSVARELSTGVENSAPVIVTPGEGAAALPAKPALGDFTSEATCSSCHPHQAEEWQVSAHAHSMTDPVFRALVAKVADEAPQTERFCVSCHSTIGTLAGGMPSGASFDSFDPVVLEGVNCESCHRVTDVYRRSNAGNTLNPASPMQGSVRAGDGSPYHDTTKSGVLGTPELCASCHDVRTPSGVELEQPYIEWSESKARANGLVCIDCHMPRALGRAAEGFDLPERPVRRHTFLGFGALSAAVAAGSSEADGIRQDLSRLLEESVSLSIASDVFAEGQRARVYVLVHNHVEGHRFPAGSNFFRQLWLRARISDATGKVVYQSDPPVGVADERSLLISALLLDANGEVTDLPWRAARVENHALQPGEERLIPLQFTLEPGVRGPLLVEAWLELRGFPARLLAQLELAPDLATRIDLSATSAERVIARE